MGKDPLGMERQTLILNSADPTNVRGYNKQRDAGMKPEKFHILCHHKNTARDGLWMQKLLGKCTETGYKSGVENTEQGMKRGGKAANHGGGFSPAPFGWHNSNIQTLRIFHSGGFSGNCFALEKFSG